MIPYFRAAIAALLLPVCAQAWSGKEHALIGSRAYANACSNVGATLAVAGEHDERTKLRYDTACRLVLAPKVEDRYALQALFGDWSAIAGDHSDQPRQLTDLMLSDIVVDYRRSTKYAVTNYRHFHPAVVTSWREHHIEALDAAVAASSGTRNQLQPAYESALAIEAFAQHYLQDSFSAGHMGFNRVGSSNAAALSYHSRASKRGRCVANLRGDMWFTYGDDHLSETDDWILWEDEPTPSHVLDAAEESLEDFILAFVTGSADPEGVDTIAGLLPAFMKETRCESRGEFVSLRSVGMPATTASTWDVWFVRDATAYYSKPTMQGFMIGGSLEMAPINIGYRSIQNRFQAGFGRTYSEIGGHALLFDFQYLWHVGTSNRGIITHEIGIGEGDYWVPNQYEMFHLRAIYNANVEAGRNYMRIQVALARSSFRWGPYVSIGFGRVRRASQ